MKIKTILFGTLYLIFIRLMISCSITVDVADNAVTSNDTERLNRIDSLSVVRTDSVVIKQSFEQQNKPASKRKNTK